MTERLPKGFVLGAATAAYQIEGAAHDDGRGPSIWDTMSHTPGRIKDGSTGDVACDHYHRWREDVDLMAGLGLDAYRLSISWPRVQPGGSGPLNLKGVAFYRSLLTALRDRGIAPWVTLYHWDLPQELEDRGGWRARQTATAFAEYARLMAREFGDLVEVWTTLNEPWCSAFLGYGSGVHAPGVVDAAGSLTAAHHLNLAHGLAATTIREELPGAQVAITLNLHVTRPADPVLASDRDAVRQIDLLGNEVFLGPLLEGRYPADLVSLTSGITDWGFVLPGDLDSIGQPLDLLGVNYYSTQTVRWNPDPTADRTGGHAVGQGSPWPGADEVEFLAPSPPLTEMGWNIEPTGLSEVLTGVARRFPGLRLAVTENGAAFPDLVEDGEVHDPRRIDYVREHLGEVAKVAADGVPVEAYFLWSLLDNFEWSHGYTKRFGIIHVDYETGARTPKDSAHWYAALLRSRPQAPGQG